MIKNGDSAVRTVSVPSGGGTNRKFKLGATIMMDAIGVAYTISACVATTFSPQVMMFHRFGLVSSRYFCWYPTGFTSANCHISDHRNGHLKHVLCTIGFGRNCSSSSSEVSSNTTPIGSCDTYLSVYELDHPPLPQSCIWVDSALCTLQLPVPNSALLLKDACHKGLMPSQEEQATCCDVTRCYPNSGLSLAL